MKLEGANVLITGANRGIGLALAQVLAKRKVHLQIVVRKEDSILKNQLLELGAQSVKVWSVDLSSRTELTEFCETIKNHKIDVLINNAGLLTGGLLENQNMDEIYQMLQVNLMSAIQLTRVLIPGMVERAKGLIVNNASVSALMHFPGATTYAASKAAIWAFNNSLDLEFKGTGLSTLLLITPGVKTRMFDQIADKYGKNLEVPTDSITPIDYAEDVISAIEKDKKILFPKGATRIGLLISKYLPSLFRQTLLSKFKR